MNYTNLHGSDTNLQVTRGICAEETRKEGMRKNTQEAPTTHVCFFFKRGVERQRRVTPLFQARLANSTRWTRHGALSTLQALENTGAAPFSRRTKRRRRGSRGRNPARLQSPGTFYHTARHSPEDIIRSFKEQDIIK